MAVLTLHLPPTWSLTPDQFETLVQENRDLRLEMSARGELIIMPPTGGETGNRNFELAGQLWLWNRQAGLGKAFDSSTGFVLPNGARRSPDMSWIPLERWQALSSQQRRKFLPLCPDFAVELLSDSDDRRDTQVKMQEYLANGLRLGWLIIPDTKEVEIYRPHQDVEYLTEAIALSGEDVLPGFVVNLQNIW
ncbi:Uma2 family endonuclease [Candidatus Synechococcus calcipolaris G9]|uniref:Uma2 family endonuclease n=1 Tax=Candidatus Synechococcus calcipolaris G9 TaxID=1497997 RepID=A0ABT6EXE7_9SYNE|nr:Uma2 family endonuclease [Candidatus Synechococcus calcipolaris]MDG2990169.1 Uma2 family endonuclease [Candidatus Synechococcus calcipolaris G9]